MPKMDPAAPDPATGTSVPLAYDRTQAYDAKLAALGQQANSSCFTEMADATFFAQRPHLSKQQVLFALVRRQIIGTMLSRLLLADGWRCQFALFDGRGRPLVPLGLEVGEIMDRLMEDPESSSRTNSQSTSASRGKIAPTSWCCAANIRARPGRSCRSIRHAMGPWRP
jgi:hypothetical protein